MIKDIKGFIKMFGIHVPVKEHLNYYIEQLAKTEKYKDIKELVSDYIEFEAQFENAYDYKMSKLKEIYSFIKESHPYMEMTLDKNILDLPTNRNFSYEEDVKYVSVDMVQANWNSLKRYDQFNELGDTYDDLLDKFNCPKIFHRSKSIRQFIFGNINPRLQQKVERNMMQEIVRKFDTDFNIECVRHDEVIFSVEDFTQLQAFQELDERWRVTLFTIERKEDGKLKTVYDFNENELYKTMVGVPGNLFYLKLKQWITGEDIDIRDLYFQNDGKVAIWNVPELYKEIKHGNAIIHT